MGEESLIVKELTTSFRLDDKLTLRTFIDVDAATVFETVWRDREHLQPFMHWMTPDYDLASAEEFIERSKKAIAEKSGQGFGIFRDEEFIGSIGFVYFDWKTRKTEIGYWIDKEDEGKGIVSSACRTLIDYAFDDLSMNRIEIRCSATNARSAAIPERFGFTKEGVLRQSEWRNGQLHDFNVYGLLASEWSEIRLAL